MSEEMIYIPQTRGRCEIQADRQWLQVKKGGLFAKISMSDLAHCAVSVDYDYEFRVTTKDGKYLEFNVRKKGTDARRLFVFLNSFCAGFRDTVSTYRTHTWTHGIYYYRFDPNELAVEYKSIFSKKLKTFCRISVRDIAWVTQHHSTMDTEAPENYYLRVYTTNGKYEDLSGNNIQHCYEMALMIKDIAPQARYSIFSFTGFSGLTDGIQ